MHKAFWDILESELNDDPPVFGQAIRLLEEIKEVCMYRYCVYEDFFLLFFSTPFSHNPQKHLKDAYIIFPFNLSVRGMSKITNPGKSSPLWADLTLIS